MGNLVLGGTYLCYPLDVRQSWGDKVDGRYIWQRWSLRIQLPGGVSALRPASTIDRAWAHICSVTPCSRRSCTLKLVASTSLLSSSRINTFHTSVPVVLSSKAADGVEAPPVGNADVLEELEAVVG
jgi:hypothetical protein